MVEADHGRLKQLIGPARGFMTLKTAYATPAERYDKAYDVGAPPAAHGPRVPGPLIESTVSEPSSDEGYELGKDLLSLDPVDGFAPLLGQESGSRRAGEFRRRPFDEEPVITPDQGDVRQVCAVCPRSEKVPRPPKFAGIQPFVFAESSGRRCIAPAANGVSHGVMQGKTAGAFLERKKGPGSHEPVRNGGKRHIDTVANGIGTVEEIATDVLAVYP